MSFHLHSVRGEPLHRYKHRRGGELGEGLVTVAHEVTIDGERLRPGVDRFAADHPWVKQRPGYFTPCMGPRDVPTANAMREMYARTLDELGSTTRTSTSRPPGGLRLPPARDDHDDRWSRFRQLHGLD